MIHLEVPFLGKNSRVFLGNESEEFSSEDFLMLMLVYENNIKDRFVIPVNEYFKLEIQKNSSNSSSSLTPSSSSTSQTNLLRKNSSEGLQSSSSFFSWKNSSFSSFLQKYLISLRVIKKRQEINNKYNTGKRTWEGSLWVCGFNVKKEEFKKTTEKEEGTKLSDDFDVSVWKCLIPTRTKRKISPTTRTDSLKRRKSESCEDASDESSSEYPVQSFPDFQKRNSVPTIQVQRQPLPRSMSAVNVNSTNVMKNVVLIFGMNGVGKSTILNTIAGIPGWFKSGNSWNSYRITTKFQDIVVNGATYVDTPGIEEHSLGNIIRLTINKPSYYKIIFVFSPSCDSVEQDRILRVVSEIFKGQNLQNQVVCGIIINGLSKQRLSKLNQQYLLHLHQKFRAEIFLVEQDREILETENSVLSQAVAGNLTKFLVKIPFFNLNPPLS